MKELISAWRADGYDHDTLEVWVVGFPSTEETITSFAEGSDAACFVDESGEIADGYQAKKDDVFVFAPDGSVLYEGSFGTAPLTDADHRGAFDAVVREAMAR